ncbi:hypothetical protein ACFLRC_03805 [Candidatus Altiarchaeota archaeon]
MTPATTITPPTRRQQTPPREVGSAISGMEKPENHPGNEDLTRIPEEYHGLFRPILQRIDGQLAEIKQTWLEDQTAGQEDVLQEILKEEQQVMAWMKAAQQGTDPQKIQEEMQAFYQDSSLAEPRISGDGGGDGEPDREPERGTPEPDVYGNLKSLLAEAKQARRLGDAGREEQLKSHITQEVGLLTKRGIQVNLVELAKSVPAPRITEERGEVRRPPEPQEQSSKEPSKPTGYVKRPTNALQIARTIWRINRAVDNKLHRVL